jgi:hypothetical protein
LPLKRQRIRLLCRLGRTSMRPFLMRKPMSTYGTFEPISWPDILA